MRFKQSWHIRCEQASFADLWIGTSSAAHIRHCTLEKNISAFSQTYSCLNITHSLTRSLGGELFPGDVILTEDGDLTFELAADFGGGGRFKSNDAMLRWRGFPSGWAVAVVLLRFKVVLFASDSPPTTELRLLLVHPTGSVARLVCEGLLELRSGELVPSVLVSDLRKVVLGDSGP